MPDLPTTSDFSLIILRKKVRRSKERRACCLFVCDVLGLVWALFRFTNPTDFSQDNIMNGLLLMVVRTWALCGGWYHPYYIPPQVPGSKECVHMTSPAHPLVRTIVQLGGETGCPPSIETNYSHSRVECFVQKETGNSLLPSYGVPRHNNQNPRWTQKQCIPIRLDTKKWF